MSGKASKILLVVALTLSLWASGIHKAEAQQGSYCYLWQHYYWEQRGARQVRINYPVWCCGYWCRPACYSMYSGWGPCR